jgi:hypothetical protein
MPTPLPPALSLVIQPELPQRHNLSIMKMQITLKGKKISKNVTFEVMFFGIFVNFEGISTNHRIKSPHLTEQIYLK